MQRTLSQNSNFHRLVGLRRLDKEEKKALVLSHTKGRTEHSNDMTAAEMNAAIKQLEDEETASIKRMRAKIINIAKDIFGVTEWQQEHYDKLNKFLLGKFKRQLHRLDYTQLPNAVTAMEKWREYETKKMVNGLLNPV